jgi:hypothetical protein
MKALFIAAMLVTCAASASAAETPAKPLTSSESLPAQIAYRECAYQPKERIAALALNVELKCRDSRRSCQSDGGRGDLYARIRHTFILGVAY